MSASERAPLTTVIEPRAGWAAIELGEVWAFRELLGFLVVRDVLVKYKQAFLGVLWAILQPLVMMGVFTLFFGILLEVEAPGMPYPLFAFTGLLPWTYFSSALINSSTSLVTNRLLISKVYFPRMVLPASSVLAALVDLGLSLVVLAALMAFYGVAPTARILFLAPFTALALVCALGCGLWLSAVNVKYRDVQYTIPVMVQLWFFLSPVFYSSEEVPERFRLLYGANPMVAVIEGYRWALTDRPFPEPAMMACSVAISFALLVGGALYFKRAERQFADVV